MQVKISKNNPEQQKQEPTLKEKTAKGLFWGGMGNIIQQSIGMVFGIVIARILSPDDYGLIGMLAIFIAIANTILDSGFTVALTNKKEIRLEDYNAVFWFSVFVGIIMYVILFFTAPFIAHFYGKPELTNLSRLLFLSFLIGSAGFAHHAMLFKKLMVKERVKIDIIAVFVSSVISLVLALNGFAYWGLAVQSILYISTMVILRWYYCPWRPTFNFDFKPIKAMIGFSSKLFFTHIFGQISNNLLTVIIGKSYGEWQTGLYTQGYKWMTLGNNVVCGMINSIAQPVFVEANEDKKRQLQIFRKMVRFGAFISFPVLFGLAFIGKEFILITVGEKWLGSVPILQLFCIYGGLNYTWTLYYQLLIACGKSKIIMKYSITVSILLLVVVLFMAKYGILYMLGAYLITYLISLGGWHYFAGKQINLKLVHVLKDIFPYLLTTAGCFFIAWILTQNIQNIYILCGSKILIVATLYILIMNYSGSIIFRESLGFLLKQKEKQ
ncbi:MAG: lipopolysaccharide biosynthesis protein [Tannerella sp.]|jgi:O-antigen/teichoic acid export membrane protein|nr:lipopolysaccharide biosynthesis protein [Tannerella sp.]